MSALSPIDVAPAESSPAITLDSLSPDQRQHWRETGEFPTPDVTAPSSTAPADTPPVSTETSPAPASEPGPPAKKGAEARKAELAAEIQELLRQRAELRRDTARPAASPDVPPAASSPAPQPKPGKPVWSHFEDQIGITYQTFGDAQDAFQDARDVWKDQQIAAQRAVVQRQEQIQAIGRTFSERLAAEVATDQDFWSQISPEVANLQPRSVMQAQDPSFVRRPEHDIAEAIVTSEYGPQWMRHLSQHPEVFRSLLTLTHPEQVFREMGRIEATFTPQASLSAPPPAVTAPLSAAPPPPQTLGSKPSAIVDDVEAALASGDFKRYQEAMNRRELAQRK